jgi:CubicO group peptidase (beta-lactamase class C family)
MRSHFRFLTISLILLSILIFCSCKKDPIETYSFPLADQHNIDEDALIEAYEQADDLESLHFLIVSRNGVTVSEEYFRDSSPDSLYDIRSVTKSVTATLVGIAIDEGFIDNVNQGMGDFIGPEIYELDVQKASITVKNLIMMSSGIPWLEIGEVSEFGDWVRSPNQVNYILDKDMTYVPGSQFNYSDGNAHLVSVILTEACGMNTLQFAEEYLFEPLETTGYAWYTDNQGYYYGGVTMDLTPSAMLKFGQLYLDKGNYNGNQIVSGNWIDEATSNHIDTENIIPFQNGYGYFWWTGISHGHDYYYANGYGGQFIVVVPDSEVVIVAVNNWIGEGREQSGINWTETLRIIINEVIPSVH